MFYKYNTTLINLRINKRIQNKKDENIQYA